MTAAKKVLDKITSYSSVVIFIAMVLMVTYQVIARYFFKSPSSVTEVLTRYCFVWLIIISATYMFGQREHINISVIKDKLPKTPKMIVSIIIELVTICWTCNGIWWFYNRKNESCTVRYNSSYSNRCHLFNYSNMRCDYNLLQHL